MKPDFSAGLEVLIGFVAYVIGFGVVICGLAWLGAYIVRGLLR